MCARRSRCRRAPGPRARARPDAPALRSSPRRSCRYSRCRTVEQIHDRAVLVGRPHAAVVAQEAGPGALLTAEAARAVEEAGHEPLEAHGHFPEPPAEPLDDAIDQAAADERLPDGAVRRPPRTMAEQIAD